MKIQNTTAAILCGGKSSRMGFDKALLKYQHESLLLHKATELNKIFDQVILVSNSREKLAVFDGLKKFTILTDFMPDCGPLGGICTALLEARTSYVFVTACDMPYLNRSLIYKIYEQMDGNQVALCSHDNKTETLFAFYHKNCLPIFQKQISENNLKVRGEFSKLSVKTIRLTDEDSESAFVNINTPEDLARWKA
ncbi:MAG: molybdenum cofactor guanylyltransferase [Lachnospiraceae bacterium]